MISDVFNSGDGGSDGRAPGPLDGMVVLDMSRVFAGPLAGQWLADLGADVIKIEQPGRGDDARGLPPFAQAGGQDLPGASSAHLSYNRNKRSITLDFTKPAGHAVLLDLVRKADVLIENFKAGSLAKYRLDHASLSAVNPGLIYCSITGYGQTGPYRNRPGYDIIFQAMSGLMSLTGHHDDEPGGGPMRVGYSAVDILTGTTAALGITAALMHRMRTGEKKGQHIDLSLLDTQIFNLSHMAMAYLVSGDIPPRCGNRSYTGCPVQPFDCADFQVVVSVGNNIQWQRFCKVMEVPHLIEDPRFASNSLRVQNRDALIPLLAPLFLARKAEEWVALLDGAGVPVGPLYDLAQVFEDEQVRHRGVLKQIPHPVAGEVPTLANPLVFSETPVRYASPPPQQGEHTAEVLGSLLGLSEAEIGELARQGAI
ncbi:CaiB/BaiF CoA-transferase family protein [Paralimibaculum aggregatum]|uniref:CaiB/BaiF CoA-transferase family protein n=1 Tax=Paralimibaculum aggregatum TaxID=3036245 RepID=A0ABQ6LGI5_9RHOB|nr:CoA transferase [Limibaculum sp. NKW23]GMG82107.1 CaiB/BaiF CoA-transferase family protein [Limibaculum sp. NKW23]